MVVSGGPAISTRQWLPARPRRYQRSRSPGSRSSPLCGLCHRLTPIEIIEDVLCINHVHKSCALCVLALAIARIIRRQAVPPLPTLGTITNNVHSSTGRSRSFGGAKNLRARRTHLQPLVRWHPRAGGLGRAYARRRARGANAAPGICTCDRMPALQRIIKYMAENLQQTPSAGRVERLRRKLGGCESRPFAPLP